MSILQHLIQPYGIQVWKDLLSTLLILGLPAFMASTEKVQTRWWRFYCALSAWGSVTIIVRALPRQDMNVLIYHSAWVWVSLWLMTKTYRQVFNWITFAGKGKATHS